MVSKAFPVFNFASTGMFFRPAFNIGFGARLAGRCPAQAAVTILGFSSGLDGSSPVDRLLPSTSVTLIGSSSGAGR